MARNGAALLAVVVCSSLPTAQNIFVHATRYGRATTLARDTILVTTIGAVPLIALVGMWLYHEPLRLAIFAGAALIIAGNLVNLRAETRRPARQAG